MGGSNPPVSAGGGDDGTTTLLGGGRLEGRWACSSPRREEFHTKYNNFMEVCFLTYSGWGEDPKLLTLTDRRKEALEAALGEEWDTSWDDKYFAEEGKVYKYRDEEGNVYKKEVVVDPTEAEVSNAPHELIVIDSKGEKVRKAHDELMSWFSDELGAGFHMSDVTRSGRTPTNVR